MIRSIRAGLLAATAVPIAATIAFAEAPEPDIEAGDVIAFDVYRQGDTEFGTHEIRFTEEDGDLMAEVSVRLRAGAGPITVFRYEHDSTERWRDGELIQIWGETLKDGDRYPFDGAVNGEALVVEGTSPEGEAVTTEFPLGVLPSSHWRGYSEDTDAILYTEHGTEMEVAVEYMGEEEIEADGGTISAYKYRVEGTLTTYVYYDEDGAWAGCEFEARGQEIRYVRRQAPDPA